MSWLIFLQSVMSIVLVMVGILVFARMCFFYKTNVDPLESVKPWVYKAVDDDRDQQYLEDNG